MRPIDLIVVVLLIMWLGGFSLHVAGGLINILLAVAVVVFLARFFRRNTI